MVLFRITNFLDNRIWSRKCVYLGLIVESASLIVVLKLLLLPGSFAHLIIFDKVSKHYFLLVKKGRG